MVLVVWQTFEANMGQSQGFKSQLGLLGNPNNGLNQNSFYFQKLYLDLRLFYEAMNITSLVTMLLQIALKTSLEESPLWCPRDEHSYEKLRYWFKIQWS